MKILLIHNFYQSSSPSGEDNVFRAEKELLNQKRGDIVVSVISYERHNDEIYNFTNLKKSLLPFKTILSNETYNQLKRIIRQERPDIAHIHNSWYLLSPSVFYACKDMGTPVVQTLHNFRFFCVNALLMRQGKVCEDCIGKLPWRGVVHECYKSSMLYSLPIAVADTFLRLKKTLINKVGAFIALSEFSKKKCVECGLPENKIYVKPNFIPDPPAPKYSHGGYAVFIGRLSGEKGLDILLDAVGPGRSNIKLKVIGDGPLKMQLEGKVKMEGLRNVEFTGGKNHEECIEALRNAQFMILPSICYENFPMTIIEAFACGKPVIASRLGAMAEIIEDRRMGLLFEPGNADDLASKIKWMMENEDACIEMGKHARREFESKYTSERNYQILMDIYQKAIENFKR